MKRWIAALFVAMATACSPPAEQPMPIEGGPQAAEAPAEVLSVITAQDAGFVVRDAVEDASTGARMYVVNGASGGADVSYRLMHANEGWQIVQSQRDIAWGDAPASVRDVVAALPAAIVPSRTVEVREPGADGVIYDLYSGEPESLVMTVREADGQAAIMPPPH